ncbi:MAG: hypothetical protein KJ018_17620, partial [Burkholderiales bacterium]|nr:hypothetical protein [Burkholderiales bacterium]
DALAAGVAPSRVAGVPSMRQVLRMGEEIGDEELARFGELESALERDFAALGTADAAPGG